MLRSWTRLIQAARRPFPERFAQLASLAPNGMHFEKSMPELARVYLPTGEISYLIQHETLSLAQLRCAIAGLAAEHYRLQHGHWPQRLADLTPHYLRQVPLDPFSGQPLRCLHKDGKFVVYCDGPYSGDPEGGIDLARILDRGEGYASFLLWDVSRRRQPPRNPPVGPPVPADDEMAPGP
jgi:hypothetical protein